MLYITLPVVSFEFETWPLTLREKNRSRLFDNRCFGEYLDLKGRSGRRSEKLS
jgi:hypothetical protein